ncbi:hypothetical protein GC207_15285 [bacterium]|nr:hypothetical protein [bacterium]
MSEIVKISGMSNQEFLEAHAQPGRIGLSGGTTLIDRAISRAESRIHFKTRRSLWSHAFVFEGRRADGHHWVIESDLQLHRKHIRLGVQENRVTGYFDEKLYTCLAVLDFGLKADQVTTLLREGLELVASRTRYSLRELAGAWLGLRHHGLRSRENLLAREKSLFCSAFVVHLFRKFELDLAPGLNEKHATPEDISLTAIPHTTYILERPAKNGTKLQRLRARVRSRIKQRVTSRPKE